MCRLSIRVLGGFEAKDDAGHAIKFHTRKAAALLAYLAMSPGKEFSREHLMSLLWSDRAEAQASNSLRQALSQLRKALNGSGASPLILSAVGVSVDPEAVSIDAVEFERSASGKGRERQRATDYYQGDFLADFTVRDNAFEEWRRLKAARITSLAIETFDDLLNKAMASAAYDNAAELARNLLTIDPAHEGAHRALMKIHSLKDRRGAALQQYEDCRDFLLRELGVEPDAETEELRRTILSGRQRPTEPANAEPANTIGVLPFTTVDDDIDAQRLASGLVASIAMELGRFKSLSVVSAASSLRFKDSNIELGDIADSLDVRYLVEGSVDRSGNSLRGFVRLTEARSGRQVWGERFDARAEDVFEVIDNVIQSIVAPLAARLETEEIAAARRKSTVSLDAYDHWLRGLSHLRVISEDEEKAAQEHFQAAINIDPNFARAYSGLAMATFNSWSCAAWASWDEAIERCLAAANTALELDPCDHWPHMILANALMFRREFDRSRAHYERAITLNPNDADILAIGSFFLTYYGDPDAGVEAGLAAIRLNPFYTEVYPYLISSAFQMAGRYEETIALQNQIPDAPVGDLSWRIAMHVEMGNLDEARALAATFHEQFKGLYPGVSTTDDAREILETINPWERKEDHDRFFGALEQAGVFDEQHGREDIQRLSLVR
jgi:DNA-binding SARP family transcriptional activator/Tfp pilus assembly protein PilF